VGQKPLLQRAFRECLTFRRSVEPTAIGHHDVSVSSLSTDLSTASVGEYPFDLISIQLTARQSWVDPRPTADDSGNCGSGSPPAFDRHILLRLSQVSIHSRNTDIQATGDLSSLQAFVRHFQNLSGAVAANIVIIRGSIC
jgi:hypothetical protein